MKSRSSPAPLAGRRGWHRGRRGGRRAAAPRVHPGVAAVHARVRAAAAPAPLAAHRVLARAGPPARLACARAAGPPARHQARRARSRWPPSACAEWGRACHGGWRAAGQHDSSVDNPLPVPWPITTASLPLSGPHVRGAKLTHSCSAWLACGTVASHAALRLRTSALPARPPQACQPACKELAPLLMARAAAPVAVTHGTARQSKGVRRAKDVETSTTSTAGSAYLAQSAGITIQTHYEPVTSGICPVCSKRGPHLGAAVRLPARLGHACAVHERAGRVRAPLKVCPQVQLQH